MGTMTTEKLRDHVKNSIQQYYNKEQVLELLNKLETPKKTNSTELTLF
jgi:hypothetical protein